MTVWLSRGTEAYSTLGMPGAVNVNYEAFNERHEEIFPSARK